MAKAPKQNGIQEHGPDPDLVARAQESVSRATDYAFSLIHDDGHWYGELKSNVTLTAEHVFFYQALGLPMPDKAAYLKYLLSEQNDDGSWSIAPEHPGCVSTSAEAYLALKLLGVSKESATMRKARAFIRKVGGVAKVRIFTRIFFAQFGLFPWDYVPQLPAELILMPASAPMNVYKLSSWARSTLVPLLVMRHHEPIYALPNGTRKDNDYLDELWLNPLDKKVPYGPPILETPGLDVLSMAISCVDGALYLLGGLRRQPLRPVALRRCIRWILEHQEVEGDWAGIVPPMHAGILALTLQGHGLQDACVAGGIKALERFTWEDSAGKRLQSCVSPVWDTVLMLRGLCDAGVVDRNDERLTRTVRWVKSHQSLGPEGDWRIFRPNIPAGGWAFEYNNRWFPDVDDTAAVILALIHQNPMAVDSLAVSRAVKWTVGMQNKDGGWAAFDWDNDKLWLNKIPFSDLNALCDPSTADVTGRVLEAFGTILQAAESKQQHVDPEIVGLLTTSSERALYYLASTQEDSGSWYGRWGSNYVYGTSNVLNGLQFFLDHGDDDMVPDMARLATAWLKSVQNQDGGWGEDLVTYQDPTKAGRGPSTPSQTAWGLLGLLTTCGISDPSVAKAVSHLVSTQQPEKRQPQTTEEQQQQQHEEDQQVVGWSWPEKLYTGTGFPLFFYIGYTLYRHYFPLMALGRYVRRAQRALDEGDAIRQEM